MMPPVPNWSVTDEVMDDLLAEPLCAGLGHHMSDIVAEYPDGLYASRCERCGVRITMHRVPGGIPLLRAKSILERLCGDGGNVLDLVVLSELADILSSEREKLEEAEGYLALAKRMVDDSKRA